ncbi:hypothetical protein VA596_23855 [Amycolatopsis sp., V23-08]|uniref:Uncharacterized protein n=1 Tax=Amycolatopsis heterodermiae TaxID=3110235 RepID=A0ABU5R8P0_9PSEU|nr:hypothetical protein [Amycolatopsis sp., V23-08]MEA5362591.1 hypothetical protein [Amycolatopsis sp., V23-08]
MGREDRVAREAAAEDALVQFAKGRSRLHAQGFHQPAADLQVRLQRFGSAARVRQGPHRLCPRGFPQRVPCREFPQLRRRLVAFAGLDAQEITTRAGEQPILHVTGCDVLPTALRAWTGRSCRRWSGSARSWPRRTAVVGREGHRLRQWATRECSSPVLISHTDIIMVMTAFRIEDRDHCCHRRFHLLRLAVRGRAERGQRVGVRAVVGVLYQARGVPKVPAQHERVCEPLPRRRPR